MDALFSPARSRDAPPDLIRREAKEGSNGAHEGIQNPVDRCLRGPASNRCPGSRVKPVLEDIEVKSAQLDRRKVVKRAIDLVKCELRVSRLDALQEFRRLGKRPGVDFLQFLGAHLVLLGIEIVKVAESKAESVA